MDHELKNQDEQQNANAKQQAETAQPAKYMDLLNKTSEQFDQEQKELWAEESLMNIKGDILSTKKEITVARRDLEKLKSAKPIDPKEVVKASQKLKALQNGVQALEDLQKELF